MKLRIFLPASEHPDPAARFPWMLFDNRRGLAREDHTTLDAIPRADEVEVVLPAARVLFARLKLPRVNAATIRELLPYAVEDRLLGDPTHIHAVAGPTDTRGETVVAVIDREWLRAMLALLAAAGIHPSHAWCESALLAGGKGDWNLVLSPERGMLVDDDGVGTTFDRDAASGFPLSLRIALDEAAARGDRPDSIRVHSEHGAPPPDLARWSADAGVPLTRGTQWETLARGEPAVDTIDLLSHGFAKRRRGLAAFRVPRAAVAIAVAIVVVQVALSAADAWRLERERATLEARREAIFRDAFPDAKVVVDPELQMSRNLAELRRTHGLATSDDFLAELTRAARAETAPVRSIAYTNGKLDVRRHGGGATVAQAPK
jgi:general secretion pathway protein L